MGRLSVHAYTNVLYWICCMAIVESLYDWLSLHLRSNYYFADQARAIRRIYKASPQLMSRIDLRDCLCYHDCTDKGIISALWMQRCVVFDNFRKASKKVILLLIPAGFRWTWGHTCESHMKNILCVMDHWTHGDQMDWEIIIDDQFPVTKFHIPPVFQKLLYSLPRLEMVSSSSSLPFSLSR